ncbi:proliferation marker protein Ki-67-like [Elephas maximus indicus]|uniref:proliferation marker protein Ki-67-like n=1 Tax=Elephas maximus indicus TaxID=99487 RepID=UPI002116AE48|nr:proliferation marker protein Ki-67-like [Elephas maximus indicus]
MAPLGRVVIIRRTGMDGTHFPLSRNSCLFGRGTECDIRIQLPMVSKQHCKIEMRQQEALLINLSDSIPTQLNGAYVNHPVVLKNGDIITIVDRSFRFECGHVPGGSNTTEYLEQKCKEVMEKIIKVWTLIPLHDDIKSFIFAPSNPPQNLHMQKFEGTIYGVCQEPRSLLVPVNSPELSEENSPTDTKVPLHQEDFIRKLLISIDQKVNSASLQKSAMSLGSPIISVADVSSSYDSSSGIEEKKKEQIPLQRKRVSFGGTLRPEVFDKQMPSNMPLRRGETPKKNKFLGTQLPSILKKTVKVPMDQVPNVFSTGYGNTSCTTTAGTASVENLKVPEDFSDFKLEELFYCSVYPMPVWFLSESHLD